MLTQEELKSLLHYDPDTGIFTWNYIKSKRGTYFAKSGKVAGCTAKGNTRNHYVLVNIKNKLHKAHRLAWLYAYGKLPDHIIDHINGNGIDNRICNLRDVTRSENFKNSRLRSDNASGFNGVFWEQSCRKWRATVTVGGIKHHLGVFKNKEDAIAARKAANAKYGFHKNHGRA